MADEIGMIVKVKTVADGGQLNKLRSDVNGAVQQGAQKAFDKPVPIKGLLTDFRTKYDPAKGFASSAAPKAAKPKADPMAGILGGGGGGGMLGPLAALTIVGQGIFGAIQSVVGILAQASPALGGALKMIQKTLMMFLRPIGDLLAAFLRPIARMMMTANREARKEALKYGRPGSIGYTAAYGASLIVNLAKGIQEGLRQALIMVIDAIFGPGTGAKVRDFFTAFDNAVLGTIKTVLDGIATAIEAIKGFVETIAKPLGIDPDPTYTTIGPPGAVPGGGTAGMSDEAWRKLNEGDIVGSAAQTWYDKIFKSKWLPWFATGGYVPATPGGRLIGVGEGGEGEWIVPQSKTKGFAQLVLGSGGGTTINNLYLSGPVIGVDDLDRRVKRIMDASARESRRR